MKDKYTGHPRGFGFIKFEDLSGELDAVHLLPSLVVVPLSTFTLSPCAHGLEGMLVGSASAPDTAWFTIVTQETARMPLMSSVVLGGGEARGARGGKRQRFKV